MSARKNQLQLTEPARRDFRYILSYTQQNWGEKQMLLYKSVIDAMLKKIVKNPMIGKKQYGMMRQTAGRHRIFYRIEAHNIPITNEELA